MDLRSSLSLSRWASFIKFNVVGLSGVFVNEGALILLAASGMYYLSASALAVEISIVTNFIFNDLWTFRDRRHGHAAGRFLKFNGVMLIGLVVNVAVLYAATEYLGIDYRVSNLAGIAVAALLRYWLSVKFAWIKREELSAEPPASRPAGISASRRGRPRTTPPPCPAPKTVPPSSPSPGTLSPLRAA